MKNAGLTVLLWRGALAASILASTCPASALMEEVAKEAIHMAVAPGLDAVINHKARVSGCIGPLGPTAHFEFDGDAAVFNEVLALYGGVGQSAKILYLTEFDGSDFWVGVNHRGEGFLHLTAGGRIALAALKVPENISVEYLPAVVGPIDPAAQKRTAAAKAEIERFIANRR